MEPINAIITGKRTEWGETSVLKGGSLERPGYAQAAEEEDEKGSEKNFLSDRFEHRDAAEKAGYSKFARYRRVERVEKYPADTPLGVPSPITLYSAIEDMADRLETDPGTPHANLNVLIDLYNRLVGEH
jgi:hypothetical protein